MLASRGDMPTPTEIATVTTAGNPAGTAATARLTEVRNNSGKGVSRGNPGPKGSATLPDVVRTGMCPNELSFPLQRCALVRLRPSSRCCQRTVRDG
jgi:hypothetical protein